jgi:hypothetical protein
MSEAINYSITGDFPDQVVNTGVLGGQIRGSAIVAVLEGVNMSVVADQASCVFESQPSGGDITILDGLVAAHTQALITQKVTEQILKERVLPADYAHDLTVESTASGLVITTTISELQINDQTTVTADPSLTKYVLISLIYDAGEDVFSVEAYEKTSGEYADLDADQYLVQQNISEWYVVANGDTLVEVE